MAKLLRQITCSLFGSAEELLQGLGSRIEQDEHRWLVAAAEAKDYEALGLPNPCGGDPGPLHLFLWV